MRNSNPFEDEGDTVVDVPILDLPKIPKTPRARRETLPYAFPATRINLEVE